MGTVEIRAYDGNQVAAFYQKGVEGTGTLVDPFRSSVVLTEGGIGGLDADTPDKDGNILEVLRFISNYLDSQAASSTHSDIESSTVNVDTSLTTLLEVDCSDYSVLSLRLHNSGSEDLTTLQVQGFEASDFPYDYQLLASSTTDYTTANGKQSGNSIIPVVDSSGTLPALPNTQKAGILINCKFFQKIRLQAQVAANTTDIVIAGILKV